MPATFCVPARRPCSWPPPSTSGTSVDAVADDERADTLRAAELVPGDRDEVGGRRVRLARSSHCGAWTASVCSTACGRVLAHERRDVGERLDDAGLVVDEHHRDDRGALVERRRERVEIDAAVGVARRSSRRGTLRARAGAAAPSTALCSMPVVTTPSSPTGARARRRAAPFTARLSASLPLPVNTTSPGPRRAPRRRSPGRPRARSS